MIEALLVLLVVGISVMGARTYNHAQRERQIAHRNSKIRMLEAELDFDYHIEAAGFTDAPGAIIYYNPQDDAPTW